MLYSEVKVFNWWKLLTLGLLDSENQSSEWGIGETCLKSYLFEKDPTGLDKKTKWTIWVICSEVFRNSAAGSVSSGIEPKEMDLLDSWYDPGKIPNVVSVLGPLFKKTFWSVCPEKGSWNVGSERSYQRCTGLFNLYSSSLKGSIRQRTYISPWFEKELFNKRLPLANFLLPKTKDGSWPGVCALAQTWRAGLDILWSPSRLEAAMILMM